MPHCPTIVNQTEHSIVVFQERGILYNKQVLKPGEAVNIARSQTGGVLVPYYIHAVIGDENNLPSRRQSIKNLVAVSAIPTAFVVGALATAASGGTLTGPSAVVAKMVSGKVAAGKVSMLSKMLIKEYPEKFMCKSGRLMPGKRFVAVRGGMDESLSISTMGWFESKKLKIECFKEPTDTIKDKVQYYLPGLGKSQTQPKEDRNDAVVEREA